MAWILKPVQSKKEWSDFFDLPWSIYRNNPYWVPPLRIAVRDLLNVNQNPFFKHASMHPVLVYRGEECVGRVVGIIDENHNRFHSEEAAFFGFFEAIEDFTGVSLLMDEVARWARSKHMKLLRGPMSPSTNHECGLLVEGFQDSPAVMMAYNPPYYAELLEKWGLSKVKDLYAYSLDGRKIQFSNRILAHAQRLQKRGKVTFRSVKMSHFDQEVEKILEVYNDAWGKNWGFVPMDPDEFRHMAKDLKFIVDPELLLLAEVKGETVGFALTLPDVNQAIQKVKDGRLFPTGIFKLLWNIKGPGKKQTIHRCRVLTLGIKKAYQEYGIGPLLYTEYLRRGPALGYPVGEASWILEDNRPMNKALELMGAERTKVYRLYERLLS